VFEEEEQRNGAYARTCEGGAEWSLRRRRKKAGTMIIDDYDDAALETVREVCQELFHKNYINEFVFSPNESLKKANFHYSFIMSHYNAIEELLGHSGWKLRHDELARVLYLTSDYSVARVVLNKIESYFLLAVRLIYDDKKTHASASGEVYITVRDIIEQLTTLGAVDSVPKTDREKALRTLAGKNIISRMTGKWGDMDARLAILPSVICAISSEKTANVLKMMSSGEAEEQNDTPDTEKSSEEDEEI